MKKLFLVVLIPSTCFSAEFSPVKDDAISLDVLGGLGAGSYQYVLFKDGTYFFQHEQLSFTADPETENADGVYSGKLTSEVLQEAFAHIAESYPGDEDYLYDCDNGHTDGAFIKIHIQQNAKVRALAYYTGCDNFSEHSESIRKLIEIFGIQSYLEKN